MQTTDDMALVREFAAQNSQAAFETLVARHLGLVYSAALRQVGNPQLAEEVTQTVFIILARKAASLRDGTFLTGWLFKTTRYAALAELRAVARLRRRETEYNMQCIDAEPPDEQAWQQIAPHLDEALSMLGETDRRAVLLRHFEGRELSDVGAKLDLSGEAARKRVARGLEKLRKYLRKRGVILSAAAIAASLTANSVQAAPAGLTISTVSVVKGSTAAASTIALVKGTLNIMKLAKLKLLAVVGSAAILTSGGILFVNHIVAQNTSVDDSAWSRMDTRALNALQPAFVLRPTHFSSPVQGMVGGLAVNGNKMLGRALTFDALMGMAYGVDPSHVVSASDKPAGHYDLLMTTPDASKELLQAEIKRQFGYVAHKDLKQTEVLVLTLKQSNAPGLHPSAGHAGAGGVMSGSSSSRSSGALSEKFQINSSNQEIKSLIKNLQGYFDKPILDHTGLQGNFDVSLKVATQEGESKSDAILRVMPAQLGLELVPASEQVEMLIVEKFK